MSEIIIDVDKETKKIKSMKAGKELNPLDLSKILMAMALRSMSQIIIEEPAIIKPNINDINESKKSAIVN